MARKKPTKSAASTRLPNAPLVEVVFELRWRLQGDPSQPILNSDPGLLPLLDKFTKQMEKSGFKIHQDMSTPQTTGAHGIVRRYRTHADKTFPLMQIGPGIFATNADAQYEWRGFKAQALRA